MAAPNCQNASDTLNSLRIITGQNTEAGWVGPDVNNDGKTGLAEAISALRDAASQ